MYLDRYHVTHRSLSPLKEAGLRSFKTNVFDNIKSDVCRAILGVVQKEREGADVDRKRLSTCVQVFEAMGMGAMDVYEDNFEAQLLKATREYYKGEAQKWIEADSTPEYLRKAERALDEESRRIKCYLNPTTGPKLMRVVEEELLKMYETALLHKENGGCRALLREDKNVDLKRMCELFSRPGVPDGLVPMADMVKDHIQDMGLSVVSQREAAVKDSGKKPNPNDPAFVNALLKLHHKYRKLITEEFASRPLFEKAMKNAFEVFVNRNMGKHSNAELLSNYCDRILKTGGAKLTDEVIEAKLKDIVRLFNYLIDKDLFADTYRVQLANRLLNGRCKSDNAERAMIQKLKLQCGAQFTSSMEGMLNDLNIAADHVRAFKTYLDKNHVNLEIPRFETRVLTTGFWPAYPDVKVVLPEKMGACASKFTKWYASATSHRALKFTYSLGNAIVRGQFKKWYDMEVTTMQAVVLLNLNEYGDGAVPFQALQKKTGLSDDHLKRAIHSFACGKYRILLKTNPKSRSIKATDKFKINPKFSVPTRRIRVPMASLNTTRDKKRVTEDRSIAIEAAIVRIMKARRVLEHPELMTEVLRQLSFFKPNAKVVKQRIEHLIDREYLERDKTQSNTYHYLA